MVKLTTFPHCIMTCGNAMAKLTTFPLCIMTSGDATAKQTTIPLFIMINIKQTPRQCKVSAKSKTWNLLLGFCCHAAALPLLRLWRL